MLRSKIEQIDDYVIKRILQNKIESKHGVIMKAYQGIMLKEHQATVSVAKGGEVTGELERVMFHDVDQTGCQDITQGQHSVFEALFDRDESEEDMRRRQSAPPRVISERARVRIDIPDKPPNGKNPASREWGVSDREIRLAFETLKRTRTSNMRTCKFDSRESVCGEGGKLQHQLQAMHKKRQKAITVYINKQAKASGHTTPKTISPRNSLT